MNTERICREVLRGLRRQHKSLPCKYFYDDAGSALFERICETDEYYLTRTELGIMERHVGEMASRLGPRCVVAELGSGSGSKTRLLLGAMDRPAAYVPIDISEGPLRRFAASIEAAWPAIEVVPVCADFARSLPIPSVGREGARRVVYFPGSTIGNFGPRATARLLERVGAWCGAGGGLLVAADLKKDPRLIEAAYDDREGVTAAFNLNVLVHLNHRLGADFRPDAFQHHALYDPVHGRVEMHLVAREDHDVHVAGERVHFEEGEALTTEYSYKYSLAGLARLARAAGFDVHDVWTDERRWFSVQWLVRR